MMRLVTEKKRERDRRDDRIAQRYVELSQNPSNQLTVIVQSIASEMGVGCTTVYKVVRNRRIGRKTLDRGQIMDYYAKLKQGGMSNGNARRLTAERFNCTPNYVYRIINLAI